MITITKERIFRILVFFFLSIFFACSEQTAEPLEMGYYYFPNQPGNWVIYNVDSTVYDDFTGEIYHYSYQVKEVTAGFFTDAGEKESMRLERFWRQQGNDPWLIKNVWHARLLPSRMEKTEENVSYVKLTFPVQRNKTWDGNAYNMEGVQQYRYTEVDQPFEVDNNIFDSTAVVLQKQLYTLISEDFQKEVFAKDVGMIYKKYLSLSKEVDGTIISGVDYSYSIASFGKE